MRWTWLLLLATMGCGGGGEARPAFGQVWDGSEDASDADPPKEAASDVSSSTEGSADAAPATMCCTSMGVTKVCPGPSSPTGAVTACYGDGNCAIDLGGMQGMVAGKTAACLSCSGPQAGMCDVNTDGNGMVAILNASNDYSVLCICGNRAGCASVADAGGMVECL